jgi:aldose 1-epimerase
MKIERRVFGEIGDERIAHLYTLTNDHGTEAKITNYGGIVVALRVPDRDGEMGDVVLGYDTLEEYVDDDCYFGCVVGRYANRIANGRFVLNGREYALAKNDGENHLHGGEKGFNKVLWDAKEVEQTDRVGLVLSYICKDGEEGYPGNLSVRLVYILTNEDELRIGYTATTDGDTVVNLSHHSYFNLAGNGTGDILGHSLMIDAEMFTPIREGLIPTGELRKVAGTPLDFREPTEIGSRMESDHEQLGLGRGYDHNYVLNIRDGSLALAARVCEPLTGRVMKVYTTEPGIQFYSGNSLENVAGKGGSVYRRHGGLCLEAQHFPDSPNKPGFPSTVLSPGETYSQTTVYRFSVLE